MAIQPSEQIKTEPTANKPMTQLIKPPKSKDKKRKTKWTVIVIIVLVLISIIVILALKNISETNENQSEYRIDVGGFQAELFLTGVYRNKVTCYFALNPNLLLPVEVGEARLNEFNYVLYGNNHYVGGGQITTDMFGNKIIANILNLRDYLQPSNLEQELINAVENKQTIEWKASGDVTYYTPDGKLAKTHFENLIYYQTNFGP